ncbi:MAG: hypothetical protein LiPW15_433 [Parcubacteria group bacterium LiPW_15]|nr:MAG: hypothetical protein LiPW15_433 [Parcubacteria group bacterium LiPW_15]
MSVFKDEKIWRVLTNIWTYVFLMFICANFFLHNRFERLIGPMSIIYIGILGLYVGTKEFDRWYDMHAEDRHPGELFVAAWTVIILILMGFTFILGDAYEVSSEAVAAYIMVLSVFALTQKSKALHKRKHQKK